MKTRDLLWSVTMVVLGACGGPAVLVAPVVPDAIKAPEGQHVALKFFATGTQNYTCTAKADLTGYEWKFTAPEATLYDGETEAAPKAGTHYAGPTWESVDGSKFLGDGAAAAKADAPDASAIPWLLIPRKSAEGNGELSELAFAQRVTTTGGKAPASGCDAGTSGAVEKVPYTATYYFYRPQ